MLTPEDYRQLIPIIRRVVREADASPRAQSGVPVFLAGTVGVGPVVPGDAASVRLDGDLTAVQVTNVTETALQAGQRVRVMLYPPHGADVIGVLSPPPGVRQLIYEAVADGSTGSWVFTVPSWVRLIEFDWWAYQATTGSALGMRFNGDSTANYLRQIVYRAYGAGAWNFYSAADSAAYIMDYSTPNGTLGVSRGTISPLNTGTGISTIVQFDSSIVSGAANEAHGQVRWDGGATVASIQLLVLAGTNPSVGSRFRFYGIA